MSQVGKTLVKGHGLEHEGAAHTDKGVRAFWYSQGTGGVGCGKCSCGALSPVLESGTARRKWHKQHKAEVLAR